MEKAPTGASHWVALRGAFSSVITKLQTSQRFVSSPAAILLLNAITHFQLRQVLAWELVQLVPQEHIHPGHCVTGLSLG